MSFSAAPDGRRTSSWTSDLPYVGSPTIVARPWSLSAPATTSEALAMGFLTDSFTADGPFDKQDFKAAMKREDIAKRLENANRFKRYGLP